MDFFPADLHAMWSYKEVQNFDTEFSVTWSRINLELLKDTYFTKLPQHKKVATMAPTSQN